MYYICKFSETWSVYDTKTSLSRNMEQAEIACLKSLFPGLFSENAILMALQVNSINPNKLLQLPTPGTRSDSSVSRKSEPANANGQKS